MNPPNFDAAVEMLRRALPRSAITAAVVFGSVARGEATEESDLDLLVIPRSGREDDVLETIRRVETDARVRIAAIVASPGLDELERQFLESILREGKVILGKMPKVDLRELDLEPVRLLAFDLRDLDHRAKVRFERELFGYVTRKKYKRKEYVRKVPGKISEWGGRRIGRGTVLVPERVVPEMERFLRSHKAKRILIPVWVQRP
jgi:predicted nucleotidyltransferase